MPSYRYYRLLCHAPHGAGGYYRVGEIEMRAAEGGSNLCTGGTAFGNADYYAAARAFDGSIAANSGDWAGNPGAGRTIGYDFGVSTEINVVRVRNSNTVSSAELDQHLMEFDIQGSADGSTYTTLIEVTDHPRDTSAQADYSIATYTLAGTVLDDAGDGAERTIRVYRRDTGALIAEANSASSGAFEVVTSYPGECYLVFLDDDAGVDYNTLILDRVEPV